MASRHKYADVIIAWANGATIQWRRAGAGGWNTTDLSRRCLGFYEDGSYEYRVKPEPVPDVVLYDVVRPVSTTAPNPARESPTALREAWATFHKGPVDVVKLTIKTDENGVVTKHVELV